MIVYIYGFYIGLIKNNKYSPQRHVITENNTTVKEYIMKKKFRKYIVKKYRQRKFRSNLITIYEDEDYYEEDWL